MEITNPSNITQSAVYFFLFLVCDGKDAPIEEAGYFLSELFGVSSSLEASGRLLIGD